jgi:hypothetical protein
MYENDGLSEPSEGTKSTWAREMNWRNFDPSEGCCIGSGMRPLQLFNKELRNDDPLRQEIINKHSDFQQLNIKMQSTLLQLYDELEDKQYLFFVKIYDPFNEFPALDHSGEAYGATSNVIDLEEEEARLQEASAKDAKNNESAVEDGSGDKIDPRELAEVTAALNVEPMTKQICALKYIGKIIVDKDASIMTLWAEVKRVIESVTQKPVPSDWVFPVFNSQATGSDIDEKPGKRQRSGSVASDADVLGSPSGSGSLRMSQGDESLQSTQEAMSGVTHGNLMLHRQMMCTTDILKIENFIVDDLLETGDVVILERLEEPEKGDGGSPRSKRRGRSQSFASDIQLSPQAQTRVRSCETPLLEYFKYMSTKRRLEFTAFGELERRIAYCAVKEKVEKAKKLINLTDETDEDDFLTSNILQELDISDFPQEHDEDAFNGSVHLEVPSSHPLDGVFAMIGQKLGLHPHNLVLYPMLMTGMKFILDPIICEPGTSLEAAFSKVNQNYKCSYDISYRISPFRIFRERFIDAEGKERVADVREQYRFAEVILLDHRLRGWRERFLQKINAPVTTTNSRTSAGGPGFGLGLEDGPGSGKKNKKRRCDDADDGSTAINTSGASVPHTKEDSRVGFANAYSNGEGGNGMVEWPSPEEALTVPRAFRREDVVYMQVQEEYDLDDPKAPRPTRKVYEMIEQLRRHIGLPINIDEHGEIYMNGSGDDEKITHAEEPKRKREIVDAETSAEASAETGMARISPSNGPNGSAGSAERVGSRAGVSKADLESMDDSISPLAYLPYVHKVDRMKYLGDREVPLTHTTDTDTDTTPQIPSPTKPVDLSVDDDAEDGGHGGVPVEGGEDAQCTPDTSPVRFPLCLVQIKKGQATRALLSGELVHGLTPFW